VIETGSYIKNNTLFIFAGVTDTQTDTQTTLRAASVVIDPIYGGDAIS